MTGSTTSVYTIHVYDTDKLIHVRRIKEINPDIILVMCNEEYDVEHIFQDFFKQINNWLVENNKTITVLAPGLNRKINDNIFVKKSYGYYLISQEILEVNSDLFFDINKTNKLFTLYCNRSSPERIYMIDMIAKENLLSDGIVTFRNASSKSIPKWQYHDGSPLVDEEVFVLNSKKEHSPNRFPESYGKGIVDIICESRINPQEFFTTEKTAKSIIALKPFLVLSCQHYHKYLHEEYGIEPYTEIFDYKFDDMIDVNDRVTGIVENIKSVKNLDKYELYDRVQHKIKYNREKFIDYGNNKAKMIPKELKFMFSNDHVFHGTGNGFKQWKNHAINKGWL
jgi:hypothetical protein